MDIVKQFMLNSNLLVALGLGLLFWLFMLFLYRANSGVSLLFAIVIVIAEVYFVYITNATTGQLKMLFLLPIGAAMVIGMVIKAIVGFREGGSSKPGGSNKT